MGKQFMLLQKEHAVVECSLLYPMQSHIRRVRSIPNSHDLT